MRKVFIIFLLIFVLPANASVITGGVEFNTESAREYIESGTAEVPDITFVKANLFDKNRRENLISLLRGETRLTDRTLGLFSDGSYGVNYKSNPLYVWYYGNDGVLINVEKRTSLKYPYKSFKYTPNGDLTNKTLRVSENETFIFSVNGKLLGHWIGKNCYDENNNLLMTRKIMK